ncbi:MAG: DUF1634 domain-containing protein [SAR324 cluster bacterium]
MAPPRTALEARMDVWLSWLLRLGVLVCAAILLAGLVTSFVRKTARPSDLPALARGEVLADASVAHSWSAVAAGLAEGSARAWLVVGLILLIALPILRVLLTAVLFSIERDWLYVALALLVFALLMSGLLLGRAL